MNEHEIYKDEFGVSHQDFTAGENIKSLSDKELDVAICKALNLKRYVSFCSTERFAVDLIEKTVDADNNCMDVEFHRYKGSAVQNAEWSVLIINIKIENCFTVHIMQRFQGLNKSLPRAICEAWLLWKLSAEHFPYLSLFQ